MKSKDTVEERVERAFHTYRMNLPGFPYINTIVLGREEWKHVIINDESLNIGRGIRGNVMIGYLGFSLAKCNKRKKYFIGFEI